MFNPYNRGFSNFNFRRNDRFGGGFIVPFVLGGLVGSLWNNRNVYFVPTPFFNQQFMFY